ncbi:hypothetical protein AX774_g2662 [Zancudomyces culisetae]|uniref:Uncharacterized protein n=1 Tax=Zancudomyces culisetae TaxID=1213189 RepID=A0A1R1PSF3_ZANCU|nr:hypothetical protein AX774_g2662 [Zancudomyces culisetae]|eukprot:OMH83812.1 hypothetical protein AX774_g2662 [Zancudomyces culisetae]
MYKRGNNPGVPYRTGLNPNTSASSYASAPGSSPGVPYQPSLNPNTPAESYASAPIDNPDALHQAGLNPNTPAGSYGSTLETSHDQYDTTYHSVPTKHEHPRKKHKTIYPVILNPPDAE